MNKQEFTFDCSADDFNEVIFNIRYQNKDIGKVFLAHHLIVAETTEGKRSPAASFQEATRWLMHVNLQTDPVNHLPEKPNSQQQIF